LKAVVLSYRAFPADCHLLLPEVPGRHLAEKLEHSLDPRLGEPRLVAFWDTGLAKKLVHRVKGR
jgi:hypothetical protein